MRAPGVLGILGDPTAIPDGIYYDLTARCPDVLLENDEHTVMPVGSEVEVLDGVFKGQRGVVSSSKGCVCQVEMVAFNRLTSVEIRTNNVMILR
jgi:transcription antitermination factor NusG